MRALKIGSLVLILGLLQGCDIFSLYPLSETKDLITPKGLEGVWWERMSVDETSKMSRRAQTIRSDLRATRSSKQDSLVSLYSQPPQTQIHLVNSEQGPYYSMAKTAYDVMDGKVVKVTHHYRMYFTEIDDSLWVSFCADKRQNMSRSGQIGTHSFAVGSYGFARVNIKDGEMNIRFLKYEWFKKLIDKNRVRIDHELVGDPQSPQIVLTASTHELRQLMRRFHKNDKAFENGLLLYQSQHKATK